MAPNRRPADPPDEFANHLIVLPTPQKVLALARRSYLLGLGVCPIRSSGQKDQLSLPAAPASSARSAGLAFAGSPRPGLGWERVRGCGGVGSGLPSVCSRTLWASGRLPRLGKSPRAGTFTPRTSKLNHRDTASLNCPPKPILLSVYGRGDASANFPGKLSNFLSFAFSGGR